MGVQLWSYACCGFFVGFAVHSVIAYREHMRLIRDHYKRIDSMMRDHHERMDSMWDLLLRRTRGIERGPNPDDGDPDDGERAPFLRSVP